MTEKAEKLNKLVDAIPGVCSEGRDGIRALVAEITGETLVEKPKPTHKIGDHFKYGGKVWLLAVAGRSDDKKVVAVNIATGSRKSPVEGTHVRSFTAITDEELMHILRCGTYALQRGMVEKVHQSELNPYSPLSRPTRAGAFHRAF